jgi:predicted esterase
MRLGGYIERGRPRRARWGDGWDSSPGQGISAPHDAGASSAYDSGGPAHDSGTGSTDLDGGAFTCGTIAPGLSTLVVGGVTRQFYVDLPTDELQPTALIFSWHGFAQLPTDFRNQMGFDPNGGSIPVVIVTPVDTGLLPPEGLDWDILKASGNVDLPFFEAMLSCLETHLNIDKTRVYSFGFSAGAVFTNLLASQFPGLFAAIVTESGAWFNDPAEVKLCNVPLPWSWPPLDPADRGNVLMTHGGVNDVTVANIISLEAASQAALPFLIDNRRTVVDCAHNLGHAIDPDVPNPLVYEYLFAHRLGQPSPLQNGLMFPNFPPSCALDLP